MSKVGSAGAPSGLTTSPSSSNDNSQTGLLDNQTVARGATTLLNLSYDYLRAGTGSGRTGQLTKILNHLNHHKDRGYAYDALGRLTEATGGPASDPLWTQTYSYDRFGNRTNVSASGNSASLRGRPDLQSLTAANTTAAPGTAGVSPAVSAEREPGSSPTMREGVDSAASVSDLQLAMANRHSAIRRSHHASRSAPTNPSTPQGGPPVFTDPNLQGPRRRHNQDSTPH
ncbi:MAG: hypothetical protein AABN95_09265 [Acidobacteriota bacterium]